MTSSLLLRRLRIWLNAFKLRFAPSLWPFLLATLAGIVVVAPLFGTSLADQAHEMALRLCYSVRGPQSPPSTVTVVALNSAGKRALGIPAQRTWPRDVVAKVIEQVSRAGATSILVDLIFSDQAILPSEDPPLVEAIEKTRAVIGSGRDSVKQPIGSSGYLEGIDPLPKFADAAKLVMPLTLWTARSGGLVTFISEQHGADSHRIPLLNMFSREDPIWQNPPGIHDRINFYGSPYTITTLSALRVLEDLASVKNDLEGRAVFIGLSDSFESNDGGGASFSGADMLLTSVDANRMPGVEVHATIFANLKSQTWLRTLLEPAAERRLLHCTSILLLWAVLVVPIMFRPIALLSIAATWFLLALWGMRNYIFVPGGELVIFLLPAATLIISIFEHLLTKVLKSSGRGTIGR